jgi:DNA-directed RNA polymerase specialized sigma subunit
MAIKAFDSYDPARGSLQSHLLSHLRRLQRTGAQEAQIISLPEQVALDRRHLDEAEEELRYTLGRDPSDMEVADQTGLSMKRIKYIRQAGPATSTGQAEAAHETGEMPASDIPGFDRGRRAWEDFVYADLSPTDQLIFDLTLGRNGRRAMPVGDIARRLGITPSAVSQRTQKIQRLLDERFDLGVL